MWRIYYRLIEGFKPWKHSAILYSDGLIYYYGNFYKLQRHDAALEPLRYNLVSAVLHERQWNEKSMLLLTLKLKIPYRKRFQIVSLSIYIPPSLRNEAKDWIQKVAGPFASKIVISESINYS